MFVTLVFVLRKSLEIGICITDREAADFAKSLGSLESVASSIVTVTFVAPEDNHAITPMIPPIEIEIPLTKSQRVHNPQCYSLDGFNRLENSKCDARLEGGSLICKCTGVASFVVVDTPPRGNQNDVMDFDATTPLAKSMRSGEDAVDGIAMQQVSPLDGERESFDSSIIMLILIIPCAVIVCILVYKGYRWHQGSHCEVSRLSVHFYGNIVLMAFIAFFLLILAAKKVGPVNGKFAETLASLLIVSISACLGLWKLILQDSITKNKLLLYACIYAPVSVSATGASLMLFKRTNDNKVLADTLGDIVVYTWTSVLGAVLILDFCVGWSRQNQTPNITTCQQSSASPDAAASTSMSSSFNPSAAFVTKWSTQVLFAVTAILVALSSILTCVNIKSSSSLELVIVVMLCLTCLFGYFLFRSVLGLGNYCLGRHSSIASWCMDNANLVDSAQEMSSKTIEKRRGSGGKGDMPPDYTEEAHGSGESLHPDEVEVADEAVDVSFADDFQSLTPHNSRTSNV